MQSASVFQLKDRLLVHSESKTIAGLWIASEPFLVLPKDADAFALGKAVSLALANSKQSVAPPNDWRLVSAPLFAAAGVSSERAFHSGSSFVSLSNNQNGYTATPHSNGGASGNNKGFHPILESQSIIGPGSNEDAIGALVLAALDACRTGA